jgi:sulfate/thiosulfate transport system permease protein
MVSLLASLAPFRCKALAGKSTPANHERVKLGWGVATAYLSLVVLLPLSAVLLRGLANGPQAFWRAVSAPQSVAALELTLIAALLVVAVNAVMGTLIAWVLVRDSFPGKSLVDGVIDLPFALPTIVAGLTLLALYGPRGPLGINVAYSRVAIVLALLFVTLAFVVRTVQPVLQDLEGEVEEAAATLGASSWLIFRRIVLPAIRPAVLSGMALGFARAMGEFGAIVLLTGNVPFSTEVSSVFIFGLVESSETSSAAAVSTVLLGLALLVLLALGWLRRGAGRHAE